MAKRSQIAVGQKWAFNRSRQVSVGDYGFETVIIKSVEAYEKGYSGVRKSNSGQGVLVSKNSRHYGEDNWIDSVVQLSQLFKLWSEYEVELEAYKIKKAGWDAQAAVAKAEREKYQKEIYQPAFREFQDVVSKVSNKYIGSYSRVEELPVEILQLVIESYKAKEAA